MGLLAFNLISDSNFLAGYLVSPKNKYNNVHNIIKNKEANAVESVHALGLKKGSPEDDPVYLGHYFEHGTSVKIKYEVTFEKDKKPDITVFENQNIDDEDAIKLLESEISLFRKKYDRKRGGGGGLNGFYLWSEPVGKPGVATYDKAKAIGFVDDDFIASGKAVDVSLRFYTKKPKVKKTKVK